MPKGPYSPAALALMARGIRLSQVAIACNATPMSVSRWLRGTHPHPPEMLGAIAVLGDPSLADHVRALIQGAA